MEIVNQSDDANRFDKIRTQIEFYLSDSSVRKDKFIQQLLQNEDGELEEQKPIDLDQFMKFNRIKQLTGEINDLKSALRVSKIVELNDHETSVRKREPIDFSKNIDKCTVYVEKLSDKVDHEWLNELFSQFGKVTHVSLPRFKESKEQKGFAFIEFEDERSTLRACDFFNFLAMKKDSKTDGETCTLIDHLLDDLTMKESNQMLNGQNLSNDKKRSNEEMNDGFEDGSDVKRIKRYDEVEIISIQAKDFKNHLQQFKVKYEQNMDQLIKLRVISKRKWSEYKKEYFILKRKFKYQTNNAPFTKRKDEKQSTNESNNSESDQQNSNATSVSKSKKQDKSESGKLNIT